MTQILGIVEIKSEDEYRNKKRHAINHFYEKLLKIKDNINTEEAKNIATERTKYMEGFLKEFYDEWDGKKQKYQEKRENMNLISWNVNGIRACIKKGFEEFFSLQDADIFCLQETKMQIIPGKEDKEIKKILNLPIFQKYHCYWNSAEKKGYSGTAIFCKQEPISVKYGINIPEHDKEGRVITLEFKDFYMVNIYTPNSKRELERLRIQASLGR